MSIDKAVFIGVGANELSKKVAGSDAVSAGRTAVATTLGAAGGAAAAGALAVVGVAAAPVTIPLAVASGAVAFVASLFD